MSRYFKPFFTIFIVGVKLIYSIGYMIKYYILTGLASNGIYELIFGAYDLDDVRFEKEATKEDEDHGYETLKIHTLSSDTQEAVDAKLLELYFDQYR